MNDHFQHSAQPDAPELVPVLGKDEIHQKVVHLARRISSDYSKEQLLVIGVLKGAFVFLSDLVRQLSIPVEIDFIQLSSYGDKDTSCGDILFRTNISTDLEGKAVLIVEDIIDTGLTMTRLVRHLRSFKPKSIRVCTLIDKYARRETPFEADYVCHTVTNGFLVGYGLDYAEKYRYLPDVYDLKF